MEKIKITIVVVLVSFFVMLLASAAETNSDKTLSPYFFIENGDPDVDHFPLKSTNAEVNINGVIADVVITQQNHPGKPYFADYLPHRPRR